MSQGSVTRRVEAQVPKRFTRSMSKRPLRAGGITLDESQTPPPRSRATEVRSQRKYSTLISRIATRRLIAPVAVIAIWLFVTETGRVSSIFVPSAGDLWQSADDMKSQLPDAIVASVTMVLSGFLLGTAIGVLLGLVMAYSQLARELGGDVLDFLRPVPIFALIPLFVLWFGIGRAPQVALVTLGTAVILGVTTIEAIRNIPSLYIRAALTLGAGRRRIYRTIILPWIFPHLLGAIRLAAAASWGLGVAAEFMGAQTGLGYLMIIRQQYLDTSGIVLIVGIYATLALGLDFAIRTIERPLTKWTERDVGVGAVAGIIGVREA